MDDPQSRTYGFSLPNWLASWTDVGTARVWWAIALACAALVAVVNRHDMNPDTLSYLDIASSALHAGPRALVNGYWSPGFPALLTSMLFVVRPSSNYEFPWVHVVHWGVFVLCLWAFSFFVRQWLPSISGDGDISSDQKKLITAFSYSIFVYFSVGFIGNTCTPDLAVAAAVFLAAGIGIRLGHARSSWLVYVSLGIVLAIGYYFKAIMFPLGLILLALLFLPLPYSKNISRSRLLLSLGAFLIVASPLLISLSVRAHALSFGESGRDNYLWSVNGISRNCIWTGGKNDPYGMAAHPPRHLSEDPLVLEFRGPLAGTYPLWYEPSYWFVGAKPKFDLRQQLEALNANIGIYKDIMFETGALFAGIFVLGVLIYRQTGKLQISRNVWWQLGWSLSACSLYALVAVEPRYVAPFLILSWMAIYGTLILSVQRATATAICATVLLSLAIPFAGHLGMESLRLAKNLAHPVPPQYQREATALQQLGLRSGDDLAFIGYAYDCYFAHYAGYRIVAQVPDSQSFWRLSAQKKEVLLNRLSSHGIKAVLVRDKPIDSTDWRDLNTSKTMRLSILLLPVKENAYVAQVRR